MTKHDYIAIADTLNRARIIDGSPEFNTGASRQYQVVVEALAGTFKQLHPGFGRDNWIKYLLGTPKNGVTK